MLEEFNAMNFFSNPKSENGMPELFSPLFLRLADDLRND